MSVRRSMMDGAVCFLYLGWWIVRLISYSEAGAFYLEWNVCVCVLCGNGYY